MVLWSVEFGSLGDGSGLLFYINTHWLLPLHWADLMEEHQLQVSAKGCRSERTGRGCSLLPVSLCTPTPTNTDMCMCTHTHTHTLIFSHTHMHTWSSLVPGRSQSLSLGRVNDITEGKMRKDAIELFPLITICPYTYGNCVCVCVLRSTTDGSTAAATHSENLYISLQYIQFIWFTEPGVGYMCV